MDKDFYVDLLDQIADGVYFVDRDRRITYWNGGAEHITGYSAAEVLDHSCSEGILRHVNDAGTQLCLHGCPLAAVMRDGQARSAKVYLHHKDGHRVPVTVRGQALRDETGEITGSVEVFTTRIENAFADLRVSDTNGALDPVTGLPPRRFGEIHLDSLLKAVQEETTTLGLLFLDVDHFKSVNDTFGHRVGDEVLRMVAQSLANGLNRGDVPVRWGGEELVALLPGADRQIVERTAERVRMLVENSWIQKGDDQVRVTVSIGATVVTAADSAEDALDRADRLMYAGKTGGRNIVVADRGALTSKAAAPIRGTSIPWQMPGEVDEAALA